MSFCSPSKGLSQCSDHGRKRHLQFNKHSALWLWGEGDFLLGIQTVQAELKVIWRKSFSHLAHTHRCSGHNGSLCFLGLTLKRQRSIKFRKHVIFIWKSINCENECPCVYLCFTPLSVPETSFSTPAANLLAPHRNPNSAATGWLFVWLCHYWTEAHRLGGWEERISTDSLWRVHLLKLCPSRAMFRLEVWGRSSTFLLSSWMICLWVKSVLLKFWVVWCRHASHSFWTSMLTCRFV